MTFSAFHHNEVRNPTLPSLVRNLRSRHSSQPPSSPSLASMAHILLWFFMLLDLTAVHLPTPCCRVSNPFLHRQHCLASVPSLRFIEEAGTVFVRIFTAKFSSDSCRPHIAIVWSQWCWPSPPQRLQLPRLESSENTNSLPLQTSFASSASSTSTTFRWMFFHSRGSLSSGSTAWLAPSPRWMSLQSFEYAHCSSQAAAWDMGS